MLADVAIVGGGPIGLATAQAAAEHGARTTVFERKPEGAPPSCCTGLVSPRTLSTLDVSNACVVQEIRALCIHLPSGRQIDLRSDEVKALTIDRTRLEEELLLRAREAGADVRFESEAVAAEPGRLTVHSGSENENISAWVIVGADGPRSRVAKWFSLVQPSHFVAAAQVELATEASPSDRVDVFVGDEVAPGFFGWSVPAQDGTLRVGLGVLPPHAPTAFLDQLLAARYPNARIRSRSAGWIPLSLASQPATAGAILVGDAAGHVKPLSGGGLYTGGLCSKIAGEIAARIAVSAARPTDDTPDLLATYPKRCLKAIGKEQAFGRSIHHHLSRLRDEDFEAVAEALDDPELLQFLADNGDIDHFHQLPDRLFSEPRLWTSILRIVPLVGPLID